jgi:hypothetical protein
MYIKHLYQKWNYGEYTLIIDIEEDFDGDVAKATHTIIEPNGNLIIAPISPYEINKTCLEFYVDCNMPSKKDNGGYNYRYPDLVNYYFSPDFEKQIKNNKGKYNGK